MPCATLLTGPVRYSWFDRHPFADSAFAYAFSYVHDDASRLVAEDERLKDDIRADSSMLVVVDIGAAYSNSFDLNQHFSGSWLGNRPFLYADVVRCIQHCCLIIHLLVSFVLALFPHNRYLACFALIEEFICFFDLVEREAMCHHYI